MMNGESGGAPASAAMRRLANQFELDLSGSHWLGLGPGLVAGKLAHICERLATASFELKSCITGRSSAHGDHADWHDLPMDVRLRPFPA
jgi:hypothetical protein